MSTVYYGVERAFKGNSTKSAGQGLPVVHTFTSKAARERWIGDGVVVTGGGTKPKVTIERTASTAADANKILNQCSDSKWNPGVIRHSTIEVSRRAK